MDQTKRCPACKVTKPASDYSPDRARRGGLASKCKACDRERSRRYYAANREKKARAYQARAADRALDYAALRAAALAIYGGACVVCGSTERLEFDHPDGDGDEHRAAESPKAAMRRMVATGAPLPDRRIRLLCRLHHARDNHRRKTVWKARALEAERKLAATLAELAAASSG